MTVRYFRIKRTIMLKICFLLGFVYGLMAVFIISALSLVGLFALPFLYRVSFTYVLSCFTAIAIGTLFGDAMFHLLPIVRLILNNIKDRIYVFILSSRFLVFIVIVNPINYMNIITKAMGYSSPFRFLHLIISGKC